MLHAERRVWDAHFVTEVGAALALVRTGEFNVVVSDIRMPGMDGAEFLERVRQLSPASVRIVLSGQTERGPALKASHVAHQFLSKPTDPESLKSAVARGRELSYRLGGPSLRAALGGLDRLPSPSATLQALHAALVEPSSDVGTIVDIVSADLGLSAKILQIVNSAFFGLRREIASVQEAVTYLGLENVRAVATSAELFESLGAVGEVEAFAAQLQAHSLGVVQLARYILPRPQRPSDLFLASQLHDIGTLAAAALVPQQWSGLISEKDQSPTAERQALGATHGDIGAYLLCLWGMPYGAVEAVARHHDPPPPLKGALQEAHAVYLAEALVSEASSLPCHHGPGDDHRFDEFASPGQLASWRRYRDSFMGAAR